MVLYKLIVSSILSEYSPSTVNNEHTSFLEYIIQHCYKNANSPLNVKPGNTFFVSAGADSRLGGRSWHDRPNDRPSWVWCKPGRAIHP